MRLYRFWLAAAVAATATAGSMAIVVPTYRLTGPRGIKTPLLVDSLNATGVKYDAAELLKASLRPNPQGVIVKGDSAGIVKLTKEGDNTLYSLSTRLRSERYSKGQLKVTSPDRFELYLNGTSTLKKITAEAEDSLAQMQQTPLELWPEEATDITVKILSTSETNGEPQIKIEYVPEQEFEDVLLFAGADVKRHMVLLDNSAGERVSGAYLSPDGKYMLTYYRYAWSEKDSRSWIVLSETATGKVINGNMQYMYWMPKGSRLYYTVQAKEGFDLYIYDPKTGATTLFAKGVPTNYMTWSPNEDYIIYSGNDEGPKETGPLRRHLDPDDREEGKRDRSFVKMYDFATGTETALTYGRYSTYLNDLSHDGKKALLSISDYDATKWPFYYSTLLEMDLTTLAVDTLVNHDGAFKSAIYSPDDKRAFILAGPDFADGIGRNIGANAIANDYDMQGFIMDIASRKVEAMTKNFDPSIGNASWNCADGLIYLAAEEGFHNNVYTLDPVKKTFKKLPTQVENTYNFSVGDYENRYMAYTGGGNNYTGRCYLMDLKTGQNTLIGDPMADSLADVDFGPMEKWSFRNPQGDEIDCRFFLPPGFDETKKYPMIVYYYGGTSPSTSGMTSPYSPQLFAAKDYVVLVINPSGTTGYGQEFSARHVNAWGKRTSDDIIEGVKEFCRQHHYVNDKKIGCIGASYGGFMTQYLVSHTDIFAAAVSHAGISNVTSYWGEGYWGYSYNAVAAAKSYPWNNPDLFTKQSSLFNADKIHTPLLLFHGTADENVPIGESVQLFNALKILGREVEFISVDDQHHFVLDDPHKKLWNATTMAWFAKWLQDDPRWWDALYGK